MFFRLEVVFLAWSWNLNNNYTKNRDVPVSLIKEMNSSDKCKSSKTPQKTALFWCRSRCWRDCMFNPSAGFVWYNSTVDNTDCYYSLNFQTLLQSTDFRQHCQGWWKSISRNLWHCSWVFERCRSFENSRSFCDQ